MNTKQIFGTTALLAMTSWMMGCSSARDVEVDGNVTAAAGTELKGAIPLEFFDVVEGDPPVTPGLSAMSRARHSTFA